MKYWAAYTSFNIRGSVSGNDLPKLRDKLIARKADYYAIFNNVPGFHSTTQYEFLVEHKNDPYFLKIGIESK